MVWDEGKNQKQVGIDQKEDEGKMTLPRTPNFRTTSDYSLTTGPYESKNIPGGSYVRPINTRWVPQHVLDDERWKHYHNSRYIFCHTKYGTYPLPVTILEEV